MSTHETPALDARIRELQHRQASDQARLRGTQDPNLQSLILDRMADRERIIVAVYAQGEPLSNVRRDAAPVRFACTQAERETLETASRACGMTISAYCRRCCGL
jgi:hypothetical protein